MAPSMTRDEARITAETGAVAGTNDMDDGNTTTDPLCGRKLKKGSSHPEAPVAKKPLAPVPSQSASSQSAPGPATNQETRVPSPPPRAPPKDDQPPSENPLLDAITALTLKIEMMSVKTDEVEKNTKKTSKNIDEINKTIGTMASKTDLESMQTSMINQTKGLINEAVSPLKSEITLLQERMTQIENSPQATSGSSTPNKTVKDLQNMVNKLDPALRRVSFTTWPKHVPAEKRIELMGTFMTTKYKHVRVSDFGNDFAGPHNDKKISTTSWVEFSSIETARGFLKAATNDNAEISVEGSSVKLKAAKTKIQKKKLCSDSGLRTYY